MIERIEIAGPDRRARRLVFSVPDLEPRTTAAAVVRVLDLQEGVEAEGREFFDGLLEAEASCARERALRILGYRERSVQELGHRLLNDGYPEQTVRATVERMKELALVDDERFATQWVRARHAAGYGPQRIRRELREKGVADETIASALSESSDGEDLRRAQRLLRATVLETPQQRERALAKLVRRGFDLHTARRAIAAFSEKGSDT